MEVGDADLAASTTASALKIVTGAGIVMLVEAKTSPLTVRSIALRGKALVLIEGGLAARETAEERALRQVEAWRALAGGWVSDRTFEDEVAELYAARAPGRDVDP